MSKYVIRNVVQSLLLLVLVLFLNFIILRLTPGNPLTTLQNNGKPLNPRDQLFASEVEKRMAVYFDPLPSAFLNWVSGAVHFDFGYSIRSGTPITPKLIEAAIGSFWLLLFGLLIGGGLGIPLGMYAAARQGSWKDKTIQIITVFFITLPGWFLYIVIEYLNFVVWNLSGRAFSFIPIYTPSQTLDSFVEQLAEILGRGIPIFFMAVLFLALFANQTRSQVLDVIHQDYVRTARTKGLPTKTILVSYIMKNSLTPLITLLGGVVPLVFSSQILIETVSGWGGLGWLFLAAAKDREYTTLMGVFTFLVIISVGCSLLADVINSWINPRIREGLN